MYTLILPQSLNQDIVIILNHFLCFLSEPSPDKVDTEKKTVKRRWRKRRASSAPFQYLAAKAAKETYLRIEELELQRQQLQIQAEQQKEQFKLQQV